MAFMRALAFKCSVNVSFQGRDEDGQKSGSQENVKRLDKQGNENA